MPLQTTSVVPAGTFPFGGSETVQPAINLIPPNPIRPQIPGITPGGEGQAPQSTLSKLAALAGRSGILLIDVGNGQSVPINIADLMGGAAGPGAVPGQEVQGGAQGAAGVTEAAEGGAGIGTAPGRETGPGRGFFGARGAQFNVKDTPFKVTEAGGIPGKTQKVGGPTPLMLVQTVTGEPDIAPAPQEAGDLFLFMSDDRRFAKYQRADGSTYIVDTTTNTIIRDNPAPVAPGSPPGAPAPVPTGVTTPTPTGVAPAPAGGGFAGTGAPLPPGQIALTPGGQELRSAAEVARQEAGAVGGGGTRPIQYTQTPFDVVASREAALLAGIQQPTARQTYTPLPTTQAPLTNIGLLEQRLGISQPELFSKDVSLLPEDQRPPIDFGQLI